MSSNDEMRGIDVGVLGVLARGHLVGPAEELVPVLLGYAEQPGDRLQRQLARHLLDEVAGPLGSGGLGDLLRAGAELLLEPSDGARGETAGDDLAKPGVLRRVHVQQDGLLQIDRVAGHPLRPRRDRAVRRAAEDVVALGHLFDVGMLGHEPIAFVAEPSGTAGHVDPVDRLGLAELGELLDGQTLEVQGRVEEVEVGRNGAGHVKLSSIATCSSASKTCLLRRSKTRLQRRLSD